VADLETFTPASPFRVIAANMLADRLAACAPALEAALSPEPGSSLILAGTTATQYERIRKQFGARGLREAESVCEREWHAGRLERPVPPCAEPGDAL
jgi:ribosomal protein L11 methylase PrmA